MKSSRNRSKKKITINTSGCKYIIIKRIAKRYLGWLINRNEEDEQFDVWWTDAPIPPEKLSSLKNYQKINHFCGTYVIGRKNNLAYNLNRMQRIFPDHYNFYPRTWTLPADMPDFRAQFGRKKKTFILKPEASCQGRGIFLIQKLEDIEPGERHVAQEYISNPMLIDNLKFDLRIYVLLAGVDPLRIYIHEQGLARFATEEYKRPNRKNIEDMCMHLTNYAINKNNSKFIYNDDSQDEDVGHKWTLTALIEHLQGEGHDTDALWAKICDMIIKTICTAQPSLAHIYRSCQPNDITNSMCFEILGFDILLDSKCQPWLLEVNQTPSFNNDSPLDEKVKTEVIMDAFNLMDIRVKNRNQWMKKVKSDIIQRTLTGVNQRLTVQQKAEQVHQYDLQRDEWEVGKLGGYSKIFPCKDSDKLEQYKVFIDTGQKNWEQITGANINRVKKQEYTDTFEYKFQEKWKRQLEQRHSNRESTSSQQSSNEKKKPIKTNSNIDLRRKTIPAYPSEPPNIVQTEDKSSVFDRLSKPRQINRQQLARIPANVQLDPNCFYIQNAQSPQPKIGEDTARDQALPNILLRRNPQANPQLIDQIINQKFSVAKRNFQQQSINNPVLSRITDHLVYQPRKGRFVASRTFKFAPWNN